LIRGGEMEEDIDKGKKKEAMEPIMMEEDHIKIIMKKTRNTCSGAPYQYKINNKKRAIANREGLKSEEEDIEDICIVEKIEKIMCTKYERKTCGPRA
jgi:hypothetical protein